MPYGEVERKRTGSRLIILSLLLLIGINGFFAATLWVDWQDSLLQARQRCESLAASLAAQAQSIVAGTDRMLSFTIEVLHEGMRHGHNHLRPGDPETLSLLQRRVPLSPHMRAAVIIGPDGTTLSDSREALYSPHTLTDRAYFIAHRDGGPDRLFIDAPMVSRIDQRWFIGMSRRIPDLEGNFAGVINAVIEPTYFKNFFKSLGVGTDGFAMLFNRTGTIYAREPDFDAFIGKRLTAQSPFLHQLTKAESGSYEETDANGRSMIVSYHALDNYPLVVMSVLWKDQVLASWYTLFTSESENPLAK